ncbi:polysaccharide deacetylase family protein [Aerococcaceae bacterium WGS1372]
MNEVHDFYTGNFDLPEKSVLITFDDAFQSTYYNAYPILKQAGVKALLFLVSNWVFNHSSDMDITHQRL